MERCGSSGILLAVMGPCKMVYGVIAGLCLLIPDEKFGAGPVDGFCGRGAGSLCGSHGCS